MGSGQPSLTAEPGGGGGHPFKARRQHSEIPAGMCDYSWRGLLCDRPSFAHGSVSPALFHGDNQLSKGKNNAVHSRTLEA